MPAIWPWRWVYIFCVLLIWLAPGTPSLATIYTWNPASAGATNWTANTNWNPNSSSPSTLSDFVFFDSSAINPNVDGQILLSNITMTASAPALTLNGSGTLIFHGSIGNQVAISNASAQAITINSKISTTNTTGFSVVIGGSGGGSITLNGDIFMPNTLNMSGGDNNTIHGNISGIASLVKSGNNFGSGQGTLTLDGNNTYSGGTRHNVGTLVLGSSNAAGTGDILLGAGNTSAINLFLSAAGITNQNIINLNTVNTGNIRIGGTNTSGTVTYAGAIGLSTNSTPSHDLILVANSGGKVAMRGSITEGSTAGNITKDTSAGTVQLFAANTYTGTTTVQGGTLEIDHALSLGTTSGVTVSGGTLLYNVGNTNTAATVTLSGGVIQEVDQNVSFGALTLTGNSSIILNSSGTSGSFRFISGTNTSGSTLTIYGWDYNSATGSGSDDLIFFTNTGFQSASFLNNVTFFGLTGGARILSSGELVPVTPEPDSILYGTLLLAVFVRILIQNSLFRFHPKSHGSGSLFKS